jgi:predicted AAA+ superfamily ATPase
MRVKLLMLFGKVLHVRKTILYICNSLILMKMYKQYIKSDLIDRKIYLEKMLPFVGKEIIKVLVGQRRVGKSYLLFQLIQHIVKENKEANIVYLNKELPEFIAIKTDTDLLEFVKSFQKIQDNFLFLDEIQEIENYPKALRALLAEGQWDIWCTGSNAEFLSSDITGSLSGRSIEFEVNPLNFNEFLEFHSLESNKDSIQLFMKYGGLPYLRKLPLTDEIIFEYLRNIYNTILYKDVISRHNIKNNRFIEDLVSFLADNTGSIVSAKKISDFLKSQRVNIPPVRVIEYLDHLCKAYFLTKVKRFDLQGKKYFEFGEKYYFRDFGLRNSIGGFKSNDINKILENLVLNHFQSYGYKSFTGDFNSKEIDFVFEKNQTKIYVQVAYLLASEDVIEREFGNLKLIDDNYPKYVVSMDELQFDNENGIIHLRLKDLFEMEL